jgi:hypothetical protein
MIFGIWHSSALRFFIRLLDALLRGLAEGFGMQVRAALRDRFHLFDLDAIHCGSFGTEKCETEKVRPGLKVLYFSVSQKTSKNRLREA